MNGLLVYHSANISAIYYATLISQRAMELLINHISQLRLDAGEAGSNDSLSLISVGAGSCVCGVEVVCALRRNVLSVYQSYP